MTACDRGSLGKYEALCSQPPAEAYESVSQVPVDEWMRLLLDTRDEYKDCSGARLVVGELPQRCGVDAPSGRVYTRPLNTDDVIFRPLTGELGLIWIPVNAYANDDRSGLVALVHASKRALSSVGLGVARLPANDVEIELVPIRGDDILLAQGSACPGGGESSQCSTVLKTLLLHEGRFVPLELRNTGNRCTGAAEIDLAKSQDIRLKTGGVRRFELTSTYVIRDNGLLVNEQLVATDLTSAAKTDGARVFRRSDATRMFEFTGAYFVYDRESLWEGMRQIRGDLQPTTRQTTRD